MFLALLFFMGYRKNTIVLECICKIIQRPSVLSAQLFETDREGADLQKTPSSMGGKLSFFPERAEVIRCELLGFPPFVSIFPL